MLLTQIKRIAEAKKTINLGKFRRAVSGAMANRLEGISRKERNLTLVEKTRYDKSKTLRYLVDEPICPVGYIQHKISMNISGKAKNNSIDEIKLKLLRDDIAIKFFPLLQVIKNSSKT